MSVSCAVRPRKSFLALLSLPSSDIASVCLLRWRRGLCAESALVRQCTWRSPRTYRSLARVMLAQPPDAAPRASRESDGACPSSEPGADISGRRRCDGWDLRYVGCGRRWARRMVMKLGAICRHRNAATLAFVADAVTTASSAAKTNGRTVKSLQRHVEPLAAVIGVTLQMVSGARTWGGGCMWASRCSGAPFA